MSFDVFKNSIWIAPSEPAAAPITIRRFYCKHTNNAVLYVSGLGYFRAYLNGRLLSDSYFMPPVSDYFRRSFDKIVYPCRDRFTHRTYYCRFDISPYLRLGENLLEIQCGGGFFVQTERIGEGEMSYSDRTQCIYTLDLGGELICSDGSEAWRESNIRYCQLFIGETVDGNFRSHTEYPVIKAKYTDTVMTPEDGIPDRITRTLVPKQIGEVNGRRIYDVGENISGFVRVKTHAEAGSKIILRFAETLDASGGLDFLSAGSDQLGASGLKQIMTDTFICPGVECEFAPSFVWHAFRYFDVVGDIDSALVCVIHADISVTSDFDSDCEGMNFLYDAYIRTQLNNYHGSTPLDCPHRERLGYTGDGQACAQSAMLTLDSKKLYHKWIRDILDCQDPDSGHVQHTAPFQGGGGGPGGWGAAVVNLPYEYFRQYGELSVLTESYPYMKKWFSYMESRIENGRIVREEDGGWCLGDWCYLDSAALPEAFVNTALYVRALQKLVRTAELCRDESNIPDYRSAASRSLEAVRADYAALSDKGSAMVYAAALGIEDMSRCAEYYDRLGYFDTGFLATELLVDLLFYHGYSDTAYRLFSSRDSGFLFMKAHGSTTLWENWRGGSRDHPMLGACTKSLFTGLLGIRQLQDSVGFDKVCITPSLPHKMKRAACSIMTPHGVIRVSLERTPNAIRVETDIPRKVSATRHDGSPIPCGNSVFFI